MKIQSLSVVVPSNKCINDCKFCVSKMHEENYKNQLDFNKPFYDLYLREYIKRIEFARDNGCNTMMITGNCEPQQNRPFLETLGTINTLILRQPFRIVEMQTTGTLIDRNYLRFLRNHVGVNTISLSISSFDDVENMAIIGMKTPVSLRKLCGEIKEYDFTLRLSLNLNASFDDFTAETILLKGKGFGADQITFRILYSGKNDTPQDRWIAQNACRPNLIREINEYIVHHGRFLEQLEFGANRYSVHDMSVVVDSDCMSSTPKHELKYLILRPDCKLYTKWDDKGSLLF